MYRVRLSSLGAYFNYNGAMVAQRVVHEIDMPGFILVNPSVLARLQLG